MNEEERARRVRIIQPDAVFSSVASVEPLAWALPYTPPALLVSFDDSTSLAGAAERAPSTIACPMRSSDRQLLRCLHAFTSHHLKAIQAADARYHPPAVFDTTEHAITTTEDSSSSSSSSSSRSAERAQEAGVEDEAARARNSSGMAVGGGMAKSSGAEIDLAGPDRSGGAEIDLAGSWLTPRLSSGRPMGGSPHKVMACPAALSRLADDVSNRLKKRPGRGRSFPTRLLSAAKELALHQAAVAREERLKVGLSADVGASVSPGSHGGEGKGVEDEEAAEAACATGSTWPLMPPALLAKHVLAIGTRLALGEGMSVLDVGATCGHALAILQARYRNKLRAMGVDGSKASLEYARRTCQGTFCVGDARQLSGLADESFDVAFTMDIMSQLTSTGDVCDVARELARVVRPGGRAMIVSVPKSSCATTHDASWDCPHCFWQLKSIDKNFWAACLSQPPASEGSGGEELGAQGGEELLAARTALRLSRTRSSSPRSPGAIAIESTTPC